MHQRLSLIHILIIGGSPTGTAGGVKTVTFAILVFCVLSVAKQEESITLFKRRVPQNLLAKALAIIVINLIVLMTSVLLLLVFDHGTFMDSCYECVSALATVGLTKGLTPNLTIAGKVIIICLLYTSWEMCGDFHLSQDNTVELHLY